MNKTTFIQDQEVQAFMHWIGQNLHTLQIDLNIKSSRFVPKGIKKRCIGFHEVLNEYIWKAEGMKTGDWLESVSTLSTLIANLRQTVDHGSDADALVACKAILKWGGNRDYNKGAYPFLAEQKHLRRYLQTAAKAFELESADTKKLAGTGKPVQMMNSMLTKVHAFYANDGLPIYDSRVAAAIATLIELWRHQTGKTHTALPETLKFPALQKVRSVHRCFPHAKSPGVLNYGQANTVIDWSSAKVRLGWLMQGILERQPFSNDETLAEQMRAFEAVLFMIGYDVSSLNGNKQNMSQLTVNTNNQLMISASLIATI